MTMRRYPDWEWDFPAGRENHLTTGQSAPLWKLYKRVGIEVPEMLADARITIEPDTFDADTYDLTITILGITASIYSGLSYMKAFSKAQEVKRTLLMVAQ